MPAEPGPLDYVRLRLLAGSDLLVNQLAGEPEAAQQVAHLLFGGVGIVFRPDCADDRFVVVQDLQVLIVVAQLNELAALGLSRGRFFLTEENAQKRGLSAAIGPHDAQPFAALELETQILEQEPVVLFRQIVDLEDDVSRANNLGKEHVGRIDERRPIDTFEFIERLLPRMRLLVQLPIMDSTNVIFLLGDVLGLSLISLELALVLFLPKADVGVVVSWVGRDDAIVQLENAVDDAIEKIAIVADDQHGLGLLGQVIFQPTRGADVEVIARFVEQHDIRSREQHFRQHDPALLTAAECLHGPMILLGVETQAFQDLFDSMIDVVGIVMPEHLVEAIVPLSQCLVLCFVRR